MIRRRATRLFAVLILALPGFARADVTLLNASYDVTREFYKDFNTAFVGHWKDTTGETVTVNQSHGGSTKQACAVIDGLQADVVTMNQSSDVDAICDIGKLILKDWRGRFPNESTTYSSPIVFLVRKGNPKNVKDWDDLTRNDVSVIVPNPKTSGNGRYSYLAAWVYVLRKSNRDQASAQEFVTRLFKNVPVLDTGGREATTTFDQRGIGDVLLTFEAEAHLVQRESGADKSDVVIPSLSVDAGAPVAVVDKVVDKRGTRKVATAYLDYLFSDEGQDIAARHFFRPRNEAVLAKYRQQFPPISLFRVEEEFGNWTTVQKTHFADGGVFDRVYQGGK